MIGPSRIALQTELFTNGSHMVGRLNMPPGQGRLVDVLNFRGESVIVLYDVEAKKLEPGSDEVFAWPMAQIRREAILLAIPHDERSPAGEDQRPLEYVAKEPHRFSFLLTNFAVVGDFHLPRGADIGSVRPLNSSEFVPLTNAEATYLPDPALTWRADVIVVNAAKAELCYPGADLYPQQRS
ncbi:MAG: hypothetical protein AMJ77_05590 [Dehalococcoidia bacterium SM23_28_2]|nr:MAG: hypothetical protein AMJ77_05590 [Dehalococcoidia bacterium SM23_28_2]